MSEIAQIADALASELNAGSFSETFTAERAWQPVFEPGDVDSLQVTVVPRSLSIINATRQHSFFDYSIDVGVQKKLGVDPDPSEIDALDTFTEEVADALRLARLAGFPTAAFFSIEREPIVARDHLEELRIFTTVLTITYRVKR